MCNAILVGNLVSEELTCCILALGWICDQRIHASEIDKDIIEEALETINSIESYYSASVVMRQERAREVASKMIKGDLLDVEEEQFLLTKLER